VEVPEGVHRIEVSFASTLPRTAGGLLTVLGLFGVIGLAGVDRLRESRSSAEPAEPNGRGMATLRALAPVVAPALIAVGLLLWLISRGSSGAAPAKNVTSETAGSSGNSRSQNEPGSAVLHLD
jgi:hypothetical protein